MQDLLASKALGVQKVDNTIQCITDRYSVKNSIILIVLVRWIVIYPAGSTYQPLSNVLPEVESRISVHCLFLQVAALLFVII